MKNDNETIDEVSLIFHGNPISIIFYDENGSELQNRCVFPDHLRERMRDSNIFIDDLEHANISTINMSSCNAGNIDYQDNLASTMFLFPIATYIRSYSL